jgi:phosphohistidine phosphatase SixA
VKTPEELNALADIGEKLVKNWPTELYGETILDMAQALRQYAKVLWYVGHLPGCELMSDVRIHRHRVNKCTCGLDEVRSDD